MPILRSHAARFHERRISSVTFTSAYHYRKCLHAGGRGPRSARFVRFWASGGAKFAMGDSLPWTSMNRRAKYDAASFILSGEMRNRTNTQTNTHTHTHKQ